MIEALILLAATAPAPEPMLDGECGDHMTVAPVDLGHGVRLHIRETSDHVWLCATLPPGSFGIGDLAIETAALSERLNLHASAQLGEWPEQQPDLAPKEAASDAWWNNRGWLANTSRFNGSDKTSGSVRFRAMLGREYQLSKARFGRGTWRIALTLAQVGTLAGNRVTVRYPAEGMATQKIAR